MEKALLKLARQLNAYDEASLMNLWEKYADIVQHFEPTKQWEESVLVFNLIQAVRSKNQLFNHEWAQSRIPDAPHEIDLIALTAPEKKTRDSEGENSRNGETERDKSHRRGKLLKLNPRSGD
ncbi:hypothetical protein [Pseudodesulfovibrio tunisiensis]|uniref:hypothetical protein n=1 Tax=Pseudodesulfovibrio tunisiensis TaxID=463192 RepID=UPI001FB2A89A|nr:hypothetical protein [Pseudodesulfovibrio tunisiensis]